MKAIMFFAEGFEEVEALSAVDVLRRGGVEVQMVSITEATKVWGAHDIMVGMNHIIEDVDISSVDAVLLPGGMPGTMHLKESEKVRELLMQANDEGKLIGAICAAPIVLGACGLLQGKRATCYPGFEEELTGATTVVEPVVIDGNIVTSRGVGTALDFGLKILEILTDLKNSEKIGTSILHY